MANIIEARVRQKVGTLEEWNNNPLILLGGEQAVVLNGNGEPVNIKYGDGTKRFSDLPFWINYDQGAYSKVSTNVLPLSDGAIHYSIVGSGTYTQALGGSVVVPVGSLGIISNDGTTWGLDQTVVLPTTSVIDGFDSTSTTEAGSANNDSILNDNINNLSSTGDVTTLIYSNFNQNGYSGVNIGETLSELISPPLKSILINSLVNYDEISITTVGGNASRRWYFTDDNLTIISLGVSNGSTGVTIFTNTLSIPLGATKFIAQVNTDNLIGNGKTTSDVSLLLTSKKGRVSILEDKKADKGGTEKTVKEVYDIAYNANNTINSIYAKQSDNFTFSNFVQDGYGGTVIGSVLATQQLAALRSYVIDDISNIKTITLSTIGGATNRRWYFTDDNLTIISLGVSNGGSGASLTNVLTPPVNATKFIAQVNTGNLTSNGYATSDVGIDVTYLSGDKLINTMNDDVTYLKDKTNNLTPKYINKPLVFKNTGVVNILWLGNSYSEDSLAYLNAFIEASGVDTSRIAVYNRVQGGGTILDWINNINTNDLVTLRRVAGTAGTETMYGRYQVLISNTPWDVIVVQEASDNYLNYESWGGDLSTIVGLYRRYCSNQNVSFAWLQSWAWASDYGVAPHGVDRYNAIIDVTKKMVLNNGINVIIPTGTAIQNARQVTTPIINGGKELTRDGTHLQFGVGRYISAGTFFYSILSPILNLPFLGTSARHALTPLEEDNQYSIAVDESNYEVCQRAVFMSVMDMWNINNPT